MLLDDMYRKYSNSEKELSKKEQEILKNDKLKKKTEINRLRKLQNKARKLEFKKSIETKKQLAQKSEEMKKIREDLIEHKIRNARFQVEKNQLKRHFDCENYEEVIGKLRIIQRENETLTNENHDIEVEMRQVKKKLEDELYNTKMNVKHLENDIIHYTKQINELNKTDGEKQLDCFDKTLLMSLKRAEKELQETKNQLEMEKKKNDQTQMSLLEVLKNINKTE